MHDPLGNRTPGASPEVGSVPEVLISARFNGPPTSANGGYAAGATVEAARSSIGWAGDVTVRLLRPPPLEVPLELALVDGTAELRGPDPGPPTAGPVAVARPEGPPTWTTHQPVDPELARAAERGYPGLRAHPFPTCFSCGPAREAGDGLRIFPGRLADGRVGSTWTPHGSVADPTGTVGVPIGWAALDCVGGWSSDLEHRPLVLAEMSARLGEPLRKEVTYVVVGTQLRSEGRKTWTASAILDGDRLVGQAEQLWLAVDWAVVQHLRSG